MGRTLTLLAAFVSMLLGLCACSGRHDASAFADGRQLTPEARYLSLTDCDGYTAAEIFTPWADSVPVMRLVIVDSGRSAADFTFPGDVTVVQAPLRRSVVFSSVHTSAIDELGALDAVCAVADGSYFPATDTVSALLASGRIADIGSSLSPMTEKIVDADPDAIILSPYEDADQTALRVLGIPVIQMADYLEATPLGRASWLRLIGALYGRAARADSICRAVDEAYNDIHTRAARASSRPRVITERAMSGVWYVPAGHSYMARMLADAGADYPWADTDGAGSLPLDEAAVIDRGADASVWLIKNFGALDSAAIAADMPHARAFRAFPGGVYICDTAVKPYYNSVAFHPERVLADLAAIFHPDLFDTDSIPRYFEPLK